MARPQLPPEAEREAPESLNDFLAATPDPNSLSDPKDYSAVGGPDSEPAYGRTRAAAGEYPFNEHGGEYDRDELSHVERGGIMSRHRISKQT